MTSTLLITCIAAFLLAAVNGANDVSKGIATLVGTSVTGYRSAIRWGSICTGVGGFVAIFSTSAMIRNFGGGLLKPGHTPSVATALACVLGAALWVLCCTRAGLPVSTSHSIVGAIVGVFTLAFGARSFQWGALGSRLLMPLLLSPFAALLITLIMLRTLRAAEAFSARLAIATKLTTILAAAPDGSACLAATSDSGEGAANSRRVIAGSPTALSKLHWLSSGLISFARGMNDAPKMVALLVGTSAATAAAVSQGTAFGIIIAGMVAGSIVGGRRVTEVLAERIVQPTPPQGFAANAVTAMLVIGGAVGGLPMSTTHVSSSAIAAAGIEQGAGALKWKTLRQMAFAWLVTLPGAAVLSAAVYASLQVCAS